MLKLHGFPVSNYANMVQLALLEKGVPFEYALAFPGQSAGMLAQSPRGKVPFLETPQGYINETSAILEYLEDRGEGKPLLPADPYARAQVRALMREIELYIELPARSCYAEAYFGATLPDAIKAKARDDLKAGFATLGRHGKFSPYVAGAEFTLADIVFLYSAEIANGVTLKLFGLDLLDGIVGAKALLQRLGENPSVQAIARARDAGMPAFLAAAQAKLKAAQ
jgi:glutathione S-transferase